MPGLTIKFLPYKARVVPDKMLNGVERVLLCEGCRVVGVTGAGSRSVERAMRVMLDGVSDSLKA